MFSIDLGVQNVVTAIDPKTGAKNDRTRDLDARQTATPSHGLPARWRRKVVAARVVQRRDTKRCSMCRSSSRAWISRRSAPGGRGSLSTGVRWTLRPRPDSDGKYGRVQADQSRDAEKSVWTESSARAADRPASLATAGGVVFAGALDRVFAAYDDDNGQGAVADRARTTCRAFCADQLHGERQAVRRDGQSATAVRRRRRFPRSCRRSGTRPTGARRCGCSNSSKKLKVESGKVSRKVKLRHAE